MDHDEIFAPVVPQDAIRTILGVEAQKDGMVDLIVVAQAYLKVDLDYDVYLNSPEGVNHDVAEEEVCKLLKSIYVLKQSAR